CSGIEDLPYVLGKLGLHGMYSIDAGYEVGARCDLVIRLCQKGNARPKVMFNDISHRRPCGFSMPAILPHGVTTRLG
ncbi:MAG: hypothetical protein ACKPKO_60180, partial [Candidatus Fonsibacter sp.]